LARLAILANRRRLTYLLWETAACEYKKPAWFCYFYILHWL